MKSWQLIVFGLFSGLLAAGAILIIAQPNRGEPVELPEPLPDPGIMVDVGGAVANPGVYHLPLGSRVEDAVEAAGGMLPDAYSEVVNMAEPLLDGSKVLVPLKPAGLHEDTSGESVGSESGALININTADKETLMALPGIGETKAGAIISYRTENGAFTHPEQLMDVSGIGPVTYENLKHLITIY